ncbi:hypothetical protein LJC36_02790 [Desulfovibrio sp. OttesenSCG-928-C14]|nr:hypothetical protein [Desulfovibrio sp. OttesenSCG-928-C14]
MEKYLYEKFTINNGINTNISFISIRSYLSIWCPHGISTMERWSEDGRVFLAQCSIVDDLTPELCARLTGREGSEAIFRELCAAAAILKARHMGLIE